MADRASDRPVDRPVSTEKKLDELYELIDGIRVAMLTTRRADGQLVSRPMQTQERRAGADLWFVANRESTEIVAHLAGDSHVNCAYDRDDHRDWVSVSGRGVAMHDPELIHALYKPEWRAWLPDEGDGRDGGPDDPRIALIFVEAQFVTYQKAHKARPLVLFETLRARATGAMPDIDQPEHLEGPDLRGGR